MTRLLLTASLLFAASVSASDLIARSASDLGSLFSRQTTTLDPSSIPTQCRSACTGIVSSLNSCTTMTCLCTPTNGRGLEACVNCLYDLAPSAAMRQQGQSILDNFVSGCNGAISPLTVTGGSPTGGVSTATGSSTGIFPPVSRTSQTSFTIPATTSRTSTPGAQQTIGGGGGNPFNGGSNNGASELARSSFMVLLGIAGGAGVLLA